MHGPMITAQDLRRLASEAQADERTAARFMAGVAVRPLVRGRLIDAAARLGLAIPEVYQTPAKR